MKPWTSRPPSHYWFGVRWDDYYVSLKLYYYGGSCLDRSNFDVALRMLGGEDGGNVIVISDNGCKWIGIHKDAVDKVAIGEQIERILDEYAVLDEHHYCALEAKEIQEYWDSMSWQERKELCRNKKAPLRYAWSKSAPIQDDDIYEYLVRE